MSGLTEMTLKVAGEGSVFTCLVASSASVWQVLGLDTSVFLWSTTRASQPFCWHGCSGEGNAGPTPYSCDL